jgi:hypothetical protein
MKLRFLLLNPAPLCLVTLIAQTSIVGAQEPAPPPAVPPAPAPVAPPAAEAPIPAAPTPEQPTPPPAALQAPADPNAPPPPTTIAPAAPEVAPPAEPPKDDLGAISIGAWGRVDVVLSNGAEAIPGNFPSGSDVDDTFSTGEFEFHSSGKVHKYVSLTLNLATTYTPSLAGSFEIQDGIVQIEPSPYFNVWLGRHLVPIDRSNFAGPYFMSPWFYPGFGFADGQVAVPREGNFGRNNGVTVWGQVEGGMFKYFAGVFDLHLPGASPLYSGRLSVSLLNPEPGFWGTATYHGMDVFSVGVGAQYKNDGSVATDDDGDIIDADDYSMINVDVLYEKNLGAAGVLDLEGAFLKFMGDNEGTDIGWFALASYILPAEVAGGKLQPLVRFQQANAPDDVSSSWILDAQVNYIVNSYATRFSLGYRRSQADSDAFEDISAVFFGAQVQK